MSIIQKKSVAVIGAGISGITAACILHKIGFKVQVLEAADRIGGRLWSVWQGDTQLAMGAMWLHGIKGNPLLPLMLKYKVFEPLPGDDCLDDSCIEEESHQYDYSVCSARTDKGELIDIGIVQRIERRVREAMSEAAELDEAKAVDKFGDSLGRYVEWRLGKQADELSLAVTRSVLLLYANVEGVDDLKQVSIIGNIEYRELPGNRFARGGFALLPTRLSEQLPDDSIRLLTRVLSVEINDIDNRVELAIEGGCERESFDHVVVTSPLPTLADLLPDSAPVERRRRLLAADQLNLGIVDKIFVKFKDPIDLGCRHLWLVRTELNNNWTDGLFSVTAVNHGGDTFLLWLAGKFAEEMEAKTEEEVTSELKEFLDRAMGRKLPDIEKITRTNYGSNPLLGGSYCHCKPKCDVDAIRQLAEPIWIDSRDGGRLPLIFFGGEHCSPEFYSTVHGAFKSGLDAAKELSKFYKLEFTDNEMIGWL